VIGDTPVPPRGREVREPDVAFLVRALRKEVESSTTRVVAEQADLSHGCVHNLVTGTTRVIYGTTLTKLRSWYLRRSTEGALTPDTASYLVPQLLAPIHDEEQLRSGAVELIEALERIFESRGAPFPMWLDSLRDEYLLGRAALRNYAGDRRRRGPPAGFLRGLGGVDALARARGRGCRSRARLGWKSPPRHAHARPRRVKTRSGKAETQSRLRLQTLRIQCTAGAG
jgi:hypothetical protein